MWDRAWVTVWYIFIALILAYEIYSLIDNSPATPPLTQVLVREVPWWITIPFLSWLLVHFIVAYAEYLRWW